MDQNTSKKNIGYLPKPDEHVLPIKIFLRTFVTLFVLFCVNIGVFLSGIPAPYGTFLLLTVATIQTILVAVFFMELIHEEKFFSFIFGSCMLFMILFLGISLLEITGRNFFHPDEGAHILRGFDQQGVYAPAKPALPPPSENSVPHSKKH